MYSTEFAWAQRVGHLVLPWNPEIDEMDWLEWGWWHMARRFLRRVLDEVVLFSLFAVNVVYTVARRVPGLELQWTVMAYVRMWLVQFES